MCHYTYFLFTCCSEPKEYDGVDVYDVIFCNDCPLSADGELYDDDFFHCPYVTSECLGDSPWCCPECGLVGALEVEDDGVDRGKDPSDAFSEYEEEMSEGGGAPVDMQEVNREVAYRHPFFSIYPPIWQG